MEKYKKLDAVEVVDRYVAGKPVVVVHVLNHPERRRVLVGSFALSAGARQGPYSYRPTEEEERARFADWASDEAAKSMGVPVALYQWVQKRDHDRGLDLHISLEVPSEPFEEEEESHDD